MNKRVFGKSLAAVLLVCLGWLLWPVYWFEAHNEDLPFPPFGWETMGDNAPIVQDLRDPAYQEAGDRVLRFLEESRVAIGAPGISAAVFIDEKIVWRGASGWSDLSANTPVTPETVFRIGSTSKAITATALARLVDNGVIDLDAPVSRYLGELPNPEWENITPRMLASHMSGLPHYKKNRDWAGFYQTIALRKHYKDVRDAVRVFDGSPLLFEPGTEFYYSTLGTVLLGAVMSEAAGKPYRQIIREEVFDPAGMTSTIVAPKKTGDHESLATFYHQDHHRFREWRPVDLSHRLPGGGYASTPSDLVRMGALQFDSNYISTRVRDAFWTPQRLVDGTVNEQDYALGWRWREWNLEGVGLARNANHGGVSRGSQCSLLVFPDYNMVIAYTINTKTDSFHDFGQIYRGIFTEFVAAIAATP